MISGLVVLTYIMTWPSEACIVDAHASMTGNVDARAQLSDCMIAARAKGDSCQNLLPFKTVMAGRSIFVINRWLYRYLPWRWKMAWSKSKKHISSRARTNKANPTAYADFTKSSSFRCEIITLPGGAPATGTWT